MNYKVQIQEKRPKAIGPAQEIRLFTAVDVRTGDMANEACFADDCRRVSVNKHGVFEVTAGGNPTDNRRLSCYFRHL